jgi:hypothetical protein
MRKFVTTLLQFKGVFLIGIFVYLRRMTSNGRKRNDLRKRSTG